MNFQSVEALREKGFIGFNPIGDLFHSCSNVPKERGVYMVLYLCNKRPSFVEKGVGGFFKNINPNVSIDTLEANWVDRTIVIYIGHVGGIRDGCWSEQSLQKRIKAYMRFGMGKNSAHYGGRYIWQISDYLNLLVCWKPLPGQIVDPKKVESEMLEKFMNCYDVLPFSNLKT